jgi:hypothetical protein
MWGALFIRQGSCVANFWFLFSSRLLVVVCNDLQWTDFTEFSINWKGSNVGKQLGWRLTKTLHVIREETSEREWNIFLTIEDISL